MTPTPDQNAKRVPAPRTDAQTFIAGHQDWEGECVTAEFSRTLETELAELRQAADGMRDALVGCSKRLQQVLAEQEGFQPVFDTPPPAPLENVKAIAKALARYRALAGEGLPAPTCSSQHGGNPT